MDIAGIPAVWKYKNCTGECLEITGAGGLWTRASRIATASFTRRVIFAGFVEAVSLFAARFFRSVYFFFTTTSIAAAS